jgi:predicted O-methyltransferase YrrM
MAHGRITTEIVGEACLQQSKPAKWALLLFHMIRKMKPLKCIELGTGLGISAAYEAAALKLNGAGALVTLEGSPAFAQIAERNLELLGLRSCAAVRVGWFNDILAKVLVDARRVDCALIDGHHDERATIDYFERFLPYLSTRAIVVFDDIHWSTGMVRAWGRVSTHRSVDIAIDLEKRGVCLFGVKEKSRYRLMIN